MKLQNKKRRREDQEMDLFFLLSVIFLKQNKKHGVLWKKTSLEITQDDDEMKEKTLWKFQRLRREIEWSKRVCDDDF